MQQELDNILETITSAFPQHRNTIIALYNESQSFLEVCEDYVLCLESIQKLETDNKLNKGQKINDLKSAKIDLEEELLSRI
jgi:uncharacterized protein YdcH (DUF465 family)